MKTQFKNVSSVYRIDPVHKQPRKLNIALFALSAKKYDLFIGSQLGVESLAGDLRRHFGTDVNVEIIDCQFHNIDLFINKARSGKYDIIGLSVKIGTLEEADKIIRSVLTSDLENKPLFILGNLLATSAPKELLSRYQEFANHLIAVRGEGEELLREIVKERLNNTGSNRSVIDALIQNNTPNMAALKNEQLTLTARQVLDINQLGFPARDTLQTLISVGGLVYIRDGSGCYWNRCTFCTRREYRGGNDVHYRDEEQLLAELQQLQNLGVKRVSFTSEVFYDRGLERAERFAQKMIERGIELRFALALRTDLVYKAEDTPESNARKINILKLLKKAGLDLIFIGFESGADNQLKRYNKGISVEENTRALQILCDLSLDASIGFITFDPLMSKEDLQQNLTFIEQSGLLSSNFYPFSKLMAFRDAPITKGLENEGLLKEFDLNTISYSYKYKDPEIARIVTILEDWERDFYEFRWALTYLQRIKRMDPRTSAQADKLKDFGNELRAIEFLLLKEVAFTKNLNDDGLIREILVKFDQQRTNFLQRIRNSIVIQQEIEDKNGKLLKEIEDLYSKLNPGYASRKDIGSLRRLREYLNGTFRSSDQFAEIWDDIFIGESNDLFWAFTHETYSEQPKILDIGTGTGKGLLPIATNLKTGTLVGVDLSANMLNVARRKFQSQFPHLQTIFKQIDAHELELHLASISPFDAIIARYSLQFMNIDKVLPQAFNLLKPGGILLFNAFASNFYGVSGQFRSTNPFYTVLYFTYKRILEDYLPYLENTIIDELIGQSQISKSSNSKYELIGPAIIQDSRFDPNTLKETLLHYNFSDIQFMPAPEQYPVAEKLRHALLVSSMPFYWGVFGKFSPQLKEEIIIKTYDELPPAYGKDKTVIVTDVFVKGRKPA